MWFLFLRNINLQNTHVWKLTILLEDDVMYL